MEKSLTESYLDVTVVILDYLDELNIILFSVSVQIYYFSHKEGGNFHEESFFDYRGHLDGLDGGRSHRFRFSPCDRIR